MLRRITSLGTLGGGRAGVGGTEAQDAAGGRRRPKCCSPLQVLDGFGLLQEPAADHAGDRRRQDRRRQAQRREPARLLRSCRCAARAQPAHAKEPAQAPAHPARGRRAARLRRRHRPAPQAAAADGRHGAPVRRHPGRAAAAGRRLAMMRRAAPRRRACCAAVAASVPALARGALTSTASAPGAASPPTQAPRCAAIQATAKVTFGYVRDR